MRAGSFGKYNLMLLAYLNFHPVTVHANLSVSVFHSHSRLNPTSVVIFYLVLIVNKNSITVLFSLECQHHDVHVELSRTNPCPAGSVSIPRRMLLGFFNPRSLYHYPRGLQICDCCLVSTLPAHCVDSPISTYHISLCARHFFVLH